MYLLLLCALFRGALLLPASLQMLPFRFIIYSLRSAEKHYNVIFNAQISVLDEANKAHPVVGEGRWLRHRSRVKGVNEACVEW